MATEIDHISLANANHRTLFYLLADGPNHPEWCATVAFYKALHVVEATFAAVQRKHSTSHRDRIEALTQAPFDILFTDFKILFNASKIARYLEDSDAGSKYSKFADYMAIEDVRGIIRKRLYRVEQKALSFLSAAGKKLLIKIDPPKV